MSLQNLLPDAMQLFGVTESENGTLFIASTWGREIGGIYRAVDGADFAWKGGKRALAKSEADLTPQAALGRYYQAQTARRKELERELFATDVRLEQSQKMAEVLGASVTISPLEVALPEELEVDLREKGY